MIARYAARSLRALGLPDLLCITFVAIGVAVVTTLCGLEEGFLSVARNGGDPAVAVITQESTPESDSAIPQSTLARVSAMTELEHDGDGPLVSDELPRIVPFADGESMGEVRVRGVDAIALKVRRGVQVRGRLPGRLEAGVVVGERLLVAHPSLARGGIVRIFAHEWPVLGIVESEYSTTTSELWLDRAFLKQLMKSDQNGVLYVRLKDSGAQPELARKVRALHDEHVAAAPEPVLSSEPIESVRSYFDAMHAVLALLVLVMSVVSANTISLSFLGRTRKLGTLVVIGFTRRRLVLLLVFENAIRIGAGAVLGVAISLLAHGHVVTVDSLSLVYFVEITPRVVSRGFAAGVITGILSSASAVIQIARMNAVASLRA